MTCACDHSPLSILLGVSAGAALVAGFAAVVGRGRLTSPWSIAGLLVAALLVTVPVTALADGRAPTAEVWLGWLPVAAAIGALVAISYAWNRRSRRRRIDTAHEDPPHRDKITPYGSSEEPS
jgi:peptidoglycan/LPS O-acetylase OafA/YrhL